jgi:PAS domain S-box-containing protein
LLADLAGSVFGILTTRQYNRYHRIIPARYFPEMPDISSTPAVQSSTPETESSIDPKTGMRALVDSFDWSATPFGAITSWPVNLQAVVSLILDSPEAMVVWWGDDLRQIYNDAYAPRIQNHGQATTLGQPAADHWRDSWAAIGPQVELVLTGQPSKSYKDHLINIDRNGRVEDTYWTYSFTPVRDDVGVIRGVLVISTETTRHVLGARRQETLDWLRQRIANVDTSKGLEEVVASAPHVNPDDLYDVAMTSATTDGDFVEAPTGTRLRITSRDVGVDTNVAVLFALSPKLPVDVAFRLFLEQFTLLVATARHRIDTEARRRIVEAERDRLLLDAPVGAAVMVGDDLVYHLVNPIYAMVSGRPADTMVGKPFVDVYPELEGSPVHEKFKEVYRAGEPYVSAQPTLVQIHRNGGALDDRYFTYNLSPLRTLDGQVYGLMVIAVDVTTQVDARAEVEQLNIELQAAARAKDEFLALLGHELRNPLAPIVTALELMRMRDRSTDREQIIIRRQLSHLTRLVDDLLDVSRITRGKVELRKEELEVQEVLLRAVEMVSPVIEQKQQRLHVDIAPLRWYGDPARLAQIVSNLLTNASRYSPSQAHIDVLARVVEGQLEIEVSDNGMGIPTELLPRIFEPFVQGERKLHGSVGGLGIGLALVKNLAEMHGGSVTARSAGAVQGSTFTVRLPFTSAATALSPEQGKPGTLPGNSSRRNIIVVDDNIDAADTLADMLRAYGHGVTVAYTPETALQKFSGTKIDLAILDIGLPGMNGYELADLMRESGNNTGVCYVALTGFGQQLDKERSASAKFAAHLVKPVNLADIASLLCL